MTVTYGFYDSLAGDRVYNAEQMSKLFEGIITEGVFQSIGGGLVVVPFSGMTISVNSGRAWFFNTWTNNDSALNLNVAAAHATLNRIDRVILEVNKDLGTRANTIKMLAGTPGSSPVAPSLANTSTLKQYALADIFVGAAVTTITGGNITNKIGTAGTPFITGIVETIDVATLLAQFQFEFDTWFDALVDDLTGVQVTNLQNQINELVSGWIPMSGTCSYVSADSPSFIMNVPDADALDITVGNRIKVTQTTEKFFIVTKKGTPSGGFTPFTIFGGTDYVLANAAITFPCFSIVKSPKDFPMNPIKWTISVESSTNFVKTAPTATTWYNAMDSGNLPSITIPVGAWDVFYEAFLFVQKTAATAANMYITLANAVAVETTPLWTSAIGFGGPSGTLIPQIAVFKRNLVVQDPKQTMYLNIKTNSGGDNINVSGTIVTTKIKALCTYL